MFVNEIIKPDDVMKALIGGFEVLMINKSITNRFGMTCIPLTGERFRDVEKYVEDDDPNVIYVKTDKYVEEPEPEKDSVDYSTKTK